MSDMDISILQLTIVRWPSYEPYARAQRLCFFRELSTVLDSGIQWARYKAIDAPTL
jgi:hypothetical protein